MPYRTSPVPKDPLGKLTYRQDDLNSLKCLVAIRMSKNKVETEPVIHKNAVTTLTLESGETLTDPFAISWFLASSDPKVKGASPGAMDMQWQSFSNSEIRPFLQGLVKDGHQNRRDFAKSNNMRKNRLIAGLDTLNRKLMGNRFLVGNRLSLADILLAVDVTPILDPAWPIRMNPLLQDVLKKDYRFVREWYGNIRSQNIFVQGFKQFLSGMSYRTNSPNLNTETFASNGDVAAPAGGAAEKAKKGPKRAAGGGGGRQQRRSVSSSDKKETDMSGLVAKPLRVLCLHGYRQNDNSFREKTGAFRKMIGKYCEFTFIKAPHHVLPMSAEDINQDQRGWWFSRENDYFKADDASDCDKGFEGSLDLIQKTFELHGPFDGIIGFSQGAALLSLLCLIKTRAPETLSPSVKFDFAVMVAAFKSKSTKHAKWYAKEDNGDQAITKVTIPTLHVMGTEDRVIKKHLSEELLDLFDEPHKLFHSGGHYIPATSKQKEAYCKFLHKVSQLRTDDPAVAAAAAAPVDAAAGDVPPAVQPAVSKEEDALPNAAKPLDKNQNQGCDVKEVISADATAAAAGTSSTGDESNRVVAAV